MCCFCIVEIASHTVEKKFPVYKGAIVETQALLINYVIFRNLL